MEIVFSIIKLFHRYLSRAGDPENNFPDVNELPEIVCILFIFILSWGRQEALDNINILSNLLPAITCR